MGHLNDHPVATALTVVFVVWLARFITTTVKHRRRFKNLPGPPHSRLFGHLISLGKITTQLPKRIHPHVFAYYAIKEYDMPSVFYLDLHPINQSMLMIVDPELSSEIANSSLPKHPNYHNHLAPIVGRVNLLLSEGALWKRQRACFNPGFSVQHLMNQVPTMVDIGEKYVSILDKHAARNKVFRLEEEAAKATIDIIGKVVLDHDFKPLTGKNELIDNMRKALSWMPDTQTLNPFHRKNPLRPLFWKYYKRQMDLYIGNVLDERFKARDSTPLKKARKKASIDLALEQYFKESGQDVDSRNATMDANFRQNAVDNMLTLLFAGHDTTASTICYAYYMMEKYPETLARTRKELDDVFGIGINAAEQLKQDPYLINKCEYTLAFIKETLRLWSPASSVKQGSKDYFVKDPATGNMLPTEGLIIWPVLSSMHRDTRYWGPDADAFKPERFLFGNSDKVNPNAYRPFEKGPRNCIGQELALIELKIILALTVREFDIRTAYDELEELANDGSMWAAWNASNSGPQEGYGERMYQVLMASAKPSEGMPARVSRR